MAIEFKNLNYTYQAGTPFEQVALKDISLTIEDGSFTAIVGHTGSGKSTLIQHLNGLLKPTSGEVKINDYQITNETKNKKLNQLRREVGILFQFSESQLFEETVLKDIEFAPLNFGKTKEEAQEIAQHKAQIVGLDEELLKRSPFELSGGQMRRVALAGILAMEPKILVLDEPIIGLDPIGKKEIMQIFKKLNQQHQMTIILVTHNMDDVADYADHVVALEKGQLIAHKETQAFFDDPKWLYQHHLGLPKSAEFAVKLMEKGIDFRTLPLTLSHLANELTSNLAQRGEIHE